MIIEHKRVIRISSEILKFFDPKMGDVSFLIDLINTFNGSLILLKENIIEVHKMIEMGSIDQFNEKMDEEGSNIENRLVIIFILYFFEIRRVY